MFRTSSILFRVNLLFIFAVLSFLSASLFYVKMQLDQESVDQYNAIVSTIGKMQQFNVSIKEIRGYLEEQGFHEIEPSQELRRHILESDSEPSLGGFHVHIFQNGNDIFIALRTDQYFVVYMDRIDFVWTQYHTVIVLGSVVLVIVYGALINHLMPLQNVKNELMDMTIEGNLKKLVCAQSNKDEIGDLVREFNYVVDKLRSLEESRLLFLRSIMHELKTPLTKGRIVAEGIIDIKQKILICNVFERLNSLIDEFAKIEELASKNYRIHKKEILLSDILIEVKAMLLTDKSTEERIITHHNNDLIKADFDLFALVLKNLIDNGLKYSIDSKVIVSATKRDLIIKSKSAPLALDINDYFKPYFKDIKNPLSKGFGLGMYIIKNALDTQNLELDYRYEDGYNFFIIKDCIVESFCGLPKYYNQTRNRLDVVEEN